ncbi:MAG: ISAs1 family transposase [Defluviitaleaceae bacterium]|nr:ISAs1 family transposase [Defluviitaleaceae bacterium]
MNELKQATASIKYQGYYYKLSEIVEILIMGLLCRMQTLKDIHYWADSKAVRPMLEEHFNIRKIPCYSHFVSLVGMIDAEELNKVFMDFFAKLVETVIGKTIAIDGKTVCSTANMKHYESALHIASAFVVENGITIGQLATDSKSNEIPAVRELIRLLDVKGATIVMDALNCQVGTAAQILAKEAEYVLSVKKNQQNLYDDIAEMLEFKQSDICEKKVAPLDSATKTEKGHGRIETRKAIATHEVEWLQERCNITGIKTIGAIVTKAETRYYISSRKLTAAELMTITRQEWAVESMHWQLDVIFGEDATTLHEKNAQVTLNILRKTALNLIRSYRNRHALKLNMTDIMRKCLHDFEFLIDVIRNFNVHG